MGKSVIGKLDTLMENPSSCYDIPASRTLQTHHHAMTDYHNCNGRNTRIL
ncbi:MAG: hypothetical protein MR984_02340 [Bacteroidales bacterium]|nr:hypothetical protein [Bacteroidales bacterium]